MPGPKILSDILIAVTPFVLFAICSVPCRFVERYYEQGPSVGQFVVTDIYAPETVVNL